MYVVWRLFESLSPAVSIILYFLWHYFINECVRLNLAPLQPIMAVDKDIKNN